MTFKKRVINEPFMRMSENDNVSNFFGNLMKEYIIQRCPVISDACR